MEGIIKQDYVIKKGTGLFAVDHKRWVVLEGEELSYYKKPGKRRIGVINVKNATGIGPCLQLKKQPAFFIDCGKEVHQLVCESEKEANEWIRILMRIKQGRSVRGRTISLDDFEVLTVLGKGAYGKVQLVRHKGDGQVYAMKSLSKKLLVEFDLLGRTIVERNTLLRANHPFITAARYSFQSETKLFLVLEYVPGGELFSRLSEERKFSETRVKYYAAQLILAVGYLHSIGVLHRDLKPENILVDKDGYLKITDFGLVKEKMTGNQKTATFCGTADYIAPEMILGKSYDKAVDWWSIGILIFEMLYGYPPFYDQNTNAMYKSIVRDKVEFPPGGSEEVVDLISKLLEKDPSKRLGSGPTECEEIKQHPFFHGLDWKQLLLKSIPMEWKPEISDKTDTSQFDPHFTEEQATISYEDPSLISSETQSILTGFTMENSGVI